MPEDQLRDVHLLPLVHLDGDAGPVVPDADPTAVGVDLDVADYQEHAIGSGRDTQAAAYVECRTPDGRTVFGVGIDADVATASVSLAPGFGDGSEST